MRLINTIRLAYYATKTAIWKHIYFFAFDQCTTSEVTHNKILLSEVKIKPSQFTR